MALETNELFAERSFAGRPRMVVERNKVGTIGPVSGAPLMPVGSPLAWDESALKWAPYTQPSDAASYTITSAAADGTDGGTFSLIIDGLSIEVPFDATAAEVQALVNPVLLDAGKPYTVTAVATSGTDLGGDTVVTLNFSENAGAPSVQLDGGDLMDATAVEAGNYVLAAVDAGTQLSGTNVIAGFVAHQAVQTDASDDVQATIMLAGEVHRDDINTSDIRAALLGSPSEAEIDTALKASSLRDKGITVRGLAAVAG